MIPQILIILLGGLGLGVGMIQHGKPKEGTYNFGCIFIASLIHFAILWWGGFFNCFFVG